MRFRLASVLFVSLVVASGATAATRTPSGSVALAAPQGLHGFLLRSDEPSGDTFTRTPSFAWDPVRGAKAYQFELGTSRVFASGAVVARLANLTSPTASLALALPWITGSPYSLYAHVRAIAPSGSPGAWSASFGFNMRWSSTPTPMSAPAGLLRWTPVDGATEYNVWLLDPDKIITSESNVADEREYYMFHQGSAFSGVVHWRVRAVRALYGLTGGKQRNGVPVASYGPWSGIYTSTNPSFASGDLQPLETISDAVSTGSRAATHHLMPAFAFHGDTGVDGETSELYRIYVATDRDCVNIVFRSAIVGGPAYAPRKTGPLALPGDATALQADRGAYLPDGGEGATYTADGEHADPNEALAADTSPLTSGEDDAPAADAPTPPAPAAGTAPAAAPAAAPAGATLPVDGISFGPPIDLWDTDWPTGRYYWTVVPVGELATQALTTSLAQAAAAQASSVAVGAASQLVVGNQLQIGTGANLETVAVVGVNGSSVDVAPVLKFSHGAGDRVVRLGGAIQYRDVELPQDACASGRVLTFGKTSEPALTKALGIVPFASGLSPEGRLVSAQTATPVFYGAPVVNWQPALGASAYEIQWSKFMYPFTPAATPVLTYATSTVLALTPGRWWYRVRGLNLALPAGARAMGWSEPVGIVVAKPRYKIVPTKTH